MGVGRKAPHRTRAAYAAALAAIPLPVRAISAPVAEALTVLDQTEIDGRTVQYGTLATAPRLWVALADTTPPVLGYLTGLATADPQLHLTAPDHQHWATRPGHSDAIRAHALTVWHQARHDRAQHQTRHDRARHQTQHEGDR